MPRLCEAIKDDHRKIEQAYRYILTSTTPEDKHCWRNELALELARHCISEEQVLLPILKDRLSDGDSRSAKNHTDRDSLKEKICRLKAIPVTDYSFEPELKALWVDMAAHVRDTDHQDVARLEECLTIIESEELARKFRETMSLAPTRSNTSAARGPPSQLITDFLATKSGSIKDMDPILRGCR
ncbi:HHE domain-containing protein [Colletotrichum tofieldiae]|uniref:HHE domain-containing protein n=1 Tax=Colletotrichum tofieldiae TaxID=708197 RepID=A0A166P6B1_9PEZI|nr:HHE domain-containing protein [Colletotrichum tofieldiae]GKT56010.1 HHE domain-containing protein [Colletotrichum tofieldiae]GKT79158.1 HHE domain-containing protein [Colletotrichum tofieldiae]GKT82319.1 HHE domain-containing protein [Colletotrichum tofieldiae]